MSQGWILNYGIYPMLQRFRGFAIDNLRLQNDEKRQTREPHRLHILLLQKDLTTSQNRIFISNADARPLSYE